MNLVCTYAHTYRHVITEPLKSPSLRTGNVAVYRNGVFDEGEIGGNSIFLQQRGWYTYVCKCVCVRACVRVCVRACVVVCTCAYLHAWVRMYVCVEVYMCACVHEYIHSVCVCVCERESVYVCMYVHVHSTVRVGVKPW